ncbi:MAG: hypothetical protein WAM25_20445 [Candidatus Acidiferrales bacterium]
MGIERAERKIVIADANRRHFALAVIHLQDDGFGSCVVVNIDLPERDAAVAQKVFRAAAITAPGIGLNGYFAHIAVLLF